MSDGSIGRPVDTRDGPFLAPSLERLAGWTLPVVFVLLFVEVAYVPGVTSGTSTVNLTDLGILALTAVAIWRVRRDGADALRSSLWLWVASLALLVYVAAAALYPRISDPAYAWKTHFGTALKFAEYFVLAPALAVLIGDGSSRRRFYAVVVVFTIVAAVVAIFQFGGLKVFEAWPAGGRQPSFTGISNLGPLGAATLALGFLGELWPGSVSRRTTIAALAGGSLAIVLSGQASEGIAVVAILVSSLAVIRFRRRLEPRRIAVVVGVSVACAIGLLALRGGDITQYGRTLGLLKKEQSTTKDVQTYAQRTLMFYLGLRIWEEHPIFGAGWQSIKEQHVYGPLLPAAHKRFPDQPALAFPSPQHPWGVDNAYIQALAELGVVGAAVFVAFLATGLVLGLRGSLRAPPVQAQVAILGFLWFVVSIATWLGQGLVTGAGLAALPFLALGLIAAGRARPQARQAL